MMAILQIDPEKKRNNHKFPYKWFKVDMMSNALRLTEKKSVDDRFDARTVYEVCIDCCGEGFWDNPEYYWGTDKNDPSKKVPTSSWRSHMFDSRFTGSKDAALTKFKKHIADLEKELDGQRMNAEFRKRKERTLALVERLHAECLAFTPLTDWVTRLNSYQLKNGCYI